MFSAISQTATAKAQPMPREQFAPVTFERGPISVPGEQPRRDNDPGLIPRGLLCYLLDTNIISNIVKPAPSESLLSWIADQLDEDLHISAWTVAEVRRGLLEMPEGRRRQALEAWFAGPEGPQELFAGRVLPFDERAGLIWARLMAEETSAGRPRSALDMIVAAVAEANDCMIVTDNEKDFAGLDFINPLRPAGY